MKKIFLIRHPETTGGLRFYGSTDIGLSQQGKKQAHLLISRLAGEKIQTVYSSHLYRTHYPASLLSQNLGIPHLKLENLGEIHFGDWEGLTFEEIEKSAPHLCQKWLTLAPDFRFPEGESIKEFQQRVQQAYNFILNSSLDHDNRNPTDHHTLAIISHGGVIRILLCELLGLGLNDLWKIRLDFGAVSVIRYSSKSARVITVNDVGKL